MPVLVFTCRPLCLCREDYGNSTNVEVLAKIPLTNRGMRSSKAYWLVGSNRKRVHREEEVWK